MISYVVIAIVVLTFVGIVYYAFTLDTKSCDHLYEDDQIKTMSVEEGSCCQKEKCCKVEEETKCCKKEGCCGR